MFGEENLQFDDDSMDVDYEDKENSETIDNLKVDVNKGIKMAEPAWSSLILSETEALNDVQNIIMEWIQFNEANSIIWTVESKLNNMILYNLNQEFNILYCFKKISKISHSYLEYIMNTISYFPIDIFSYFDNLNFEADFEDKISYCSRFIDISIIGLQIITSRVGLKLNNEEFLETVFDCFVKLIYKVDEYCKNCEKNNLKEINFLKGKLFTVFELYGNFFKHAKGYIGFASKVLNELAYMFLNIFEDSFKLPINKCLTTIFRNSEDQCQILTELILNSTVSTQFENETEREEGSDFTVLLLNLIQSILHTEEDDNEYDFDDNIENAVNALLVKFWRAEKLIDVIMSTFLIKMKQKDIEKVERLSMLKFVRELIKLLFKPEWPASERFLISLAKKLSYNFLHSDNDIVVRCMCIEISSELCKMIVKENLYDLNKFGDIFSRKLDEIKNRQYESLSMVKKNVLKSLKATPLQYCLFSSVVTDYLNKSDNNQSVYNFKLSRYYHIGECLDFINREHNNTIDNDGLNERTKNKMKKMIGNMNKFFIWNLKNLFQFSDCEEYLGMTKSEVEMANKMVIVQREINEYVRNFFKVVVSCLRKEIPLQLRVTTTKCLSSIFELNYDLINMPLLLPFMTFRALDLSAQSREVHVDFLAKCISKRPDLMKKYFHIFYGRLNDQNISVRKAVISSLSILLPVMEDKLKIEVIKDVLVMPKEEQTILKEIVQFLKNRWFKEEYALEIPSDIFNEIKSVASHCNNDEKKVSFCQIVECIEDTDCILVQKIMKQFVKYFWNQISYHLEDNHTTKNENLSECLSALNLISKVLPDLFIDFIDLTLPYIQLFMSDELLKKNVLDLVEIICNTICSLKIALNKTTMDSLEKSLCSLMLIKDYNLWDRSIKTLGKMDMISQKTTDKPIKYVTKCIEHFNEHNITSSDANLRIMIYHFGLFIRYYHISFFKRCTYLEDMKHDEFVKQKLISFLFKFSKNCKDPLMIKAVVKSLTEALIAYPKYFIEEKILNFFKQYLDGSPENFLTCSVIVKALYEVIKNDDKVSEIQAEADKNFKILNLEEDSLPFKIMSAYYYLILGIYFKIDSTTRVDCYKLISLNVLTGIINPHDSIRYLVASLCDSKLIIENEVLSLLLNVERKSPKTFLQFIIEGMVQGRNILLQNDSEITFRGFYLKADKNKNIKKSSRSMEVTSYFNIVYKFILKYKYYKNSFFKNILEEISVISRSYDIIREKMFIVDSIATLNYKETDSLKFIVEKCGSILDVSGSEYLKYIGNILETDSKFKESLKDPYTFNEVLRVLKSLDEEKLLQLVNYVMESYSFAVLCELRSYLLKRYKIKDDDEGEIKLRGLNELDLPIINYKHIFNFQMPLLDGGLKTLSEYICYFYSSIYELD
ncbi:Nipped-B-like protein [Strongyloides ratti]|uniref:Nipped-B protein n=1 Tax=Strongyloides ratti TaxID=34506 RepID=A0A090LGJ6_STRRB|nr:Nipped-B-like protein [Strongyloides ratti]CEF67223.1 Nipped-B-like protein [Strongyloides ratti]